jgi:hypothetical protein
VAHRKLRNRLIRRSPAESGSGGEPWDLSSGNRTIVITAGEANQYDQPLAARGSFVDSVRAIAPKFLRLARTHSARLTQFNSWIPACLSLRFNRSKPGRILGSWVQALAAARTRVRNLNRFLGRCKIRPIGDGALSASESQVFFGMHIHTGENSCVIPDSHQRQRRMANFSLDCVVNRTICEPQIAGERLILTDAEFADKMAMCVSDSLRLNDSKVGFRHEKSFAAMQLDFGKQGVTKTGRGHRSPCARHRPGASPAARSSSRDRPIVQRSLRWPQGSGGEDRAVSSFTDSSRYSEPYR